MRKTETGVWLLRKSTDLPARALRIAAVTLGIGIVMSVGVARAQDDDDDDKTFEEKIIGNLMAGGNIARVTAIPLVSLSRIQPPHNPL